MLCKFDFFFRKGNGYMTKFLKRKRVLSLLLALALLIGLMPPLRVPIYSEGLAENAESDSGLINYGAAIGAVAQWNYVTSVLLASNHYESKGDVCAGVSVNALPNKLAIVDYAYNDANAVLWYKVDAAPGYTWPEEYANYHWVDSYTVKIVSQNGMTGVFDADGNAVTELSMGVYDTPVLAAESSLQGSVAYQWQIEYETGKWVDIYGENEKEITVSIGILASILDGNETAKLRCVSSSGEKSAVSAALAVTVSQNAGADGGETTDLQDPPASSDATALRSAAANEGVAPAAQVEEYTVTITYKYENGKQAWEYYSGEVSPGETLTEKVIFPVIPGYAPYLNGERVDSLELNVIGDNVTADILYEVVYKPVLVNVTVVIEHQNIYDDGYTPIATKVIQRLTGSYIETITEFADQYPGFYQLEHSKPEVASDGSTTVTIKFNRLYYLMRFDLGEGGYGVQPVYARYGAEVEVPNPRRPGYIFQNWKSYDGSTVNAVDGMAKFAMPAYACTVTAIWEATEANYTIVYWKENADPNADGTYGYSYWTSEVVPSKAGEYVSGGDAVEDIEGENAVDDAKYFTYNDVRTDKGVLVKGDSSTVVNVYYTRNYYTIYFRGTEVSGNCAITAHTHGDGNCSSYLICGKEVHTHTTECEKILNCNLIEHEHKASCTDMTCNIAEHTHSNACCALAENNHTHSTDCYDSVGAVDTPYFPPDNPVDGQIYKRWYGVGSYSGIYINGTWHSYSGNLENGQVATPTCGELRHAHGDGNCTCSKAAHTHGDNCYGLICGSTAHKHGDGCYTYLCGKTGHNHTNACYSKCSLPVHTHTNNNPNCNGNSTSNIVYVITAKYEATIGDIWPTADKFPNIKLYGWNLQQNGNGTTYVSKRVNMTSNLCDTSDGLLYLYGQTGGSTQYLHYMFESFDQTSPENGNERILYNYVYYDSSDLYYQVVNGSGDWSAKEILGMDDVKADLSNSPHIFFYYSRVRYTLKFQNIDDVIHTENQVMFEKSLNYYLDADGNYISSIIPSYPDDLEDGAYEFAGWYTTPECFEGTKFDFTTGKMPNGDLTLFAKWAPVKHNVTFYTSRDSATGELKGMIRDTVAVPHGSKINEQYIPEAPKDFYNGQYSFDGWFYMDHGVEKAFSFADMTVTQELNVYARWISNKQINYIFHFELADGTVIADPVTGSGLAGETVTVNAKGDTALYAGYQEGYFPKFKSHSIDLDIEDEDGLMEYTFVYTSVPAVPYKVYYVAEKLKEGDDPSKYSTIVIDGKTYYIIAPTDEYEGNRKAYVVEQFKAVSGYLPDAYQKSSPIANGQTNEIIFYYTVDSTRAYYKVTHYIQNLDSTSWAEHRVSQFQGMIGSVYSAAPLNIPGYTYDGTREGTLTSGTLTADGLELKLYYVRNKYPYKVVYKVQETGAVLYDGTVETDFYEKIIPHTAPVMHGIYDLVGNATQTLNIRIEADLTNPTLNVITFYYTEREAKLNYKLVGPDGTVYDVNQPWGELTSFGESVKISTGMANGATASVKSNVSKFVGWYSDPECKNLVTEKATLVPVKENGITWTDGTTYYAKFKYDLTSLTINKQGHDAIDENQTFLFEITDENGFKLTVAVHGNGSVTVDGLTVGKQYKIVEITDWSWRYTNTGVVRELTTVVLSESTVTNGASFSLNATGNVITFANTRANSYWLDGDSWCNNIFN